MTDYPASESTLQDQRIARKSKARYIVWLGTAGVILATLDIFLPKLEESFTATRTPTSPEKLKQRSAKPSVHGIANRNKNIGNESTPEAILNPNSADNIKDSTTPDANYTLPASANNSPPVYPEQLLEELQSIANSDSLTPDQLNSAIKSTLSRLALHGEIAVAAIREFLKTGKDMNYDQVRAGERIMDQKTLRAGLFDVLVKIKGPAATTALAEVLQTTGQPQEIVTLAGMLNKLVPGEYRQAALDSASRVLYQVYQGSQTEVDVGPLFQILGDYGDAEALTGLDPYFNRWPRYSATLLAHIQPEQGVPRLLKLLDETKQDASVGETVVLLLAQTASKSPEGTRALIEGISSQKIQIPDNLWPKIAEGLAGNYDFQLMKPPVNNLPGQVDRSPYRHIMYSNPGSTTPETVYITDTKMTVDDLRARLSVIDQLVAQNINPTAIAALENTREALLRRLPPQ